MIFLTLEQLLELHALVTGETGGSNQLLDIGRLEAAVAVQTQNVFGEELYSSIYEKSAALIKTIITGHPFLDGNKRTAMLAGLTLLELNDVKFRAKKGEIEEFAVRIAKEGLGIAEIAAWLEAHSQNLMSE